MEKPSTSASAMALREAFGDRKPPDISRKITACVACRKLKIRCRMDDGNPPCARCKKRGLSCSVNKSLQMLLENDMSWKESIEQRMAGFEAVVGKLAEQISCPELLDLLQAPPPTLDENDQLEEQILPPAAITTVEQPHQTWAVVNDPSLGPAVIPSTVVSEVSPVIPGGHGQQYKDAIARGVIPIPVAESCFAAYQNRLDHFVYRVLHDQDSLSSVRRRSKLLTAAILAVGSLHASRDHFNVCYREFIKLSSEQLFSKTHSLDDVRALIIGAFWLHDVSWSLVGAAVRIAIEMKLHRCVIKPKLTSREWYLQTRLFCLVFVCDHHFSVAYGRPPLTPRDFDYPTVSDALLKCEFATDDDARLLSQVDIWSISTKIYYKVGIDTDEPIPESSMPQLQRLSIALDTWRADWGHRFTTSPRVGEYPRKGVRLHYHFAKLYLCSHAFRGAYSPESTAYNISPELEEFANLAVHSATAILRNIIDDTEFQTFLDGLPAYYDTMIAFAVVFLVKVLAKDSPAVRIDRSGTYDLMDSLSTTLEIITANMSKHHLLASIASSLRSVVDKGRQSDIHTPKSVRLPPPAQSVDNSTQDFNPVLDPGELSNFDFFFPPLGDLDFMDYTEDQVI